TGHHDVPAAEEEVAMRFEFDWTKEDMFNANLAYYLSEPVIGRALRVAKKKFGSYIFWIGVLLAFPSLLSDSVSVVCVAGVLYCFIILLYLIRDWPTKKLAEKQYRRAMQEEYEQTAYRYEFGKRIVEFNGSDCVLITSSTRYLASYDGIVETRYDN